MWLEESRLFVVLAGDIVDGIEIIGPFLTREDALQYAEEAQDYIPWVVAEMKSQPRGTGISFVGESGRFNDMVEFKVRVEAPGRATLLMRKASEFGWPSSVTLYSED